MSKVYEALKKADITTPFEEPQEIVKEKRIKLFKGNKEQTQKEEISLEWNTIDASLVILIQPDSQTAEQFKKLRTRILQRSQNKKRTFLITSSLPLEGKSFTAANIAISFALKPENYALLIDADLRKPTLHKLFGLKCKYGLSDYLEGKIELSQIFYKTFIPKLSLIPAGHSKLQPSELLSSERMKNLVEEVKNRYPDRFIFIDSTPLLITSEPDILASQVDGTLLVVRYGKTQQETLKRSLMLLEGNEIWGIVFNRVNPQSMRYKHAYYSYYKKKEAA